MIKDKFGRTHNYLRISLAERCNLRCVYCMPEEGIQLSPKNHLMTATEIEKIATVFVKLGITKIRLTGGEPLVRKDFADILVRLSKLPVELNITTNGILLDRYLDVMLEAGLRRINISLDTLDKEKFNRITRRDDFDTVMRNIRLLVSKGIYPKLNCVLMKGMNETEIADFIELTQSESFTIKFIEFMPFKGNKWDTSLCVSSEEILLAAKEKFGADNILRREDGKNSTSRNYQVKDFAGTFGIISTVTNPFCDSCNRIRLTADGKIKNCLFSKGETDILTFLRNGEDIEALIKENILQKKQERGGLSFSGANGTPDQEASRSMILIGG